MLLQPLFQHHQHPHHGSIVLRMVLHMDGSKLVYELCAHDLTLLVVVKTLQRDVPQRSMRFKPDAERKAETVLRLVDNIVGQTPVQSLFKEITRTRTAMYTM